MSLTIALKHKGIVYIGSDSLASRYGTKHYLTNPNNYRIFSVKGCDNMLMSLDGRILENNVARCNYLVPEAIAMKGDIDSLNASVAAGVLAYEIVRQRLKKG